MHLTVVQQLCIVSPGSGADIRCSDSFLLQDGLEVEALVRLEELNIHLDPPLIVEQVMYLREFSLIVEGDIIMIGVLEHLLSTHNGIQCRRRSSSPSASFFERESLGI